MAFSSSRDDFGFIPSSLQPSRSVDVAGCGRCIIISSSLLEAPKLDLFLRGVNILFLCSWVVHWSHGQHAWWFMVVHVVPVVRLNVTWEQFWMEKPSFPKITKPPKTAKTSHSATNWLAKIYLTSDTWRHRILNKIISIRHLHVPDRAGYTRYPPDQALTRPDNTGYLPDAPAIYI